MNHQDQSFVYIQKIMLCLLTESCTIQTLQILSLMPIDDGSMTAWPALLSLLLQHDSRCFSGKEGYRCSQSWNSSESR